MLRKMKLFQFT